MGPALGEFVGVQLTLGEASGVSSVGEELYVAVGRGVEIGMEEALEALLRANYLGFLRSVPRGHGLNA